MDVLRGALRRGVMLVRDGHREDRDAILSIDDVAERDTDRLDFIEQSLTSATCLVADEKRQVLGYAVLEYTFFRNGFVSMLYVAVPARRQGVGTALMTAAATRCRTRKLFTSTNKSNRSMQALLGRLGYVPSGTIENLDPGDSELIYFLDLGERSV
jgi:ribosomal protein S18 acetylase RimI-like enzyme